MIPCGRYIYKGTGYKNGAVTDFLYVEHVAPPARSKFPTGLPGGTDYSGNDHGIHAIWWDNGSGTGSTDCNRGSDDYVRITGLTGPKFAALSGYDIHVKKLA